MPEIAPLERLLSLGGELHAAPGQARRKFDLDHMRVLLRALGNPEQRFRSVLIAGTNGKGSTAATLASILKAGGYRVGLYTSPHLSRVNERIQIAGVALDDETLFAHLARVEAAASELVKAGSLPGTPSFFETMTAMAMLAFAGEPKLESPVDIAVLEVGMGGRLDATNVVAPLLSIITDISLDHTEWLGSTIAEIAREKAGILRAGGTMVTLPQHPEANQALGEVAVTLGVRGINAAEYLPGREDSSAHENRYTLTGWPGSKGGDPLSIQSPLRGQHQQRNLALAIAAAFELSRAHGYALTAGQIEQGIRETVWPGRLEWIAQQPQRSAILLDAAHNPAGAWTLRAALSRAPITGPRVLVFGCMRDKALGEMAQILFPVFDHIFLTALPSPRAASLAELTDAAAPTGASYTLCPDPQAALAAALEVTVGQADALITVAGSFILVGSVRSLLL